MRLEDSDAKKKGTVTSPNQPNTNNSDEDGALTTSKLANTALSKQADNLREAKRDIVIELSNAYFEAYRYDRPNDTVEQLIGYCRDQAELDIDELIQVAEQQLLTELMGEAESIVTEDLETDDGWTTIEAVPVAVIKQRMVEVGASDGRSETASVGGKQVANRSEEA